VATDFVHSLLKIIHTAFSEQNPITSRNSTVKIAEVVSRLFFLTFACASMAGCGSAGSSLPTLDARGIVTLAGSPVADATVVFSPTAPGGRAATARTDASGAFILSTLRPNDGALEGSYQVMIHKLTTTGGMSREEYEKNYEALTTGKMKMPKEVTKNELPEVYQTLETTPLSATVKSGQTNDFAFDLSAANN